MAFRSRSSFGLKGVAFGVPLHCAWLSLNSCSRLPLGFCVWEPATFQALKKRHTHASACYRAHERALMRTHAHVCAHIQACARSYANACTPLLYLLGRARGARKHTRAHAHVYGWKHTCIDADARTTCITHAHTRAPTGSDAQTFASMCIHVLPCAYMRAYLHPCAHQ